MGKFCLLCPELWALIDVILCSYIELIFVAGYHACLQRFYSRLFLMGSFLYLQVMMTYIRVRPRTTELAALKRVKNDVSIFSRFV